VVFFGTIRVFMGDGTYDEVEITQDLVTDPTGKTYTVNGDSAGAYDTYNARAVYLYISGN